MKKFFRRYFWVLLDVVLVNISFILSLALRFGKEWDSYFYLCPESLISISAFFLLSALSFRLYKRIWKYLSIGDLFLIAEVITIGLFISYLSLTAIFNFSLPRTVIALTWFFNLALIGGSRLLWRLFSERKIRFTKGEERLLIVGAGDAGEVISREIIRRKDLGFLVGFVDDDKDKIGNKIHNKKIFGNIINIDKIVKREKINTIIIAIPTASGDQIRRIIDNIKTREVKVKIEILLQ